MKTKLLSILLFSVCFFFLPQSAHTASYGLSIYPPLLRIQIKPGKSITQVFKIENLSPNDRFLVARIVPFSDADDYGNPIFNLKNQTNWASYFSLANSTIKLDEPFTIRGNASEQLILSLSVPETAPLRDIYATLLVSTYTNALDIGYQGTAVSDTIGSNMLITISSELNPATILKVDRLFPEKGLFFKLGRFYIADNITPLSFSTRVRNDGYFTAVTKGIFKIANKQDIPIYLDGLQPLYVISKTNRALLNTHNKPFEYIPTVGQIGIYKAVVEIKTDNSNTSNSIEIIFIPFKVGLGVLLALIILWTIIKITRKT
jgi:hypothetical protein